MSRRSVGPVVTSSPSKSGLGARAQTTTTGFELELKLLEGRNFPHVAPGHAVSFHCILNDVKQLVPPVVLERSSVRLNARIVWTFDTETLQHLRDTNSTVNLECFLVDSRAQAKAADRAGKSLGYCVLDIRAALEPTPGTAAATSKPEWYTLLPPGKKARGGASKPLLRPEIRLFFKFVATRINVAGSQDLAASLGVRGIADHRPSNVTKASLHATRSVPAVRVGDGNEDFTMTVSLVSTSHLTKLPRLGTAKKKNIGGGNKEERTDVYFYYSFLGRDLMTPPVLLHHLVPSDNSRDTLMLPANHTVFHLQSSTTDMANFLNTESPLRIFACTGEDVIGVVDVPLTTLVSGEEFRDVECSTSIQPVVTESDTKRGAAKDLKFKSLTTDPPYPSLQTHIAVVRNPSALPHLIGPYKLEVRFKSLLISDRLRLRGDADKLQLHLQYADSASFHTKPLAIPDSAESDHAAWVLDEVFEIDMSDLETKGHDILNYLCERPLRFQVVSAEHQEVHEHGFGVYTFAKEAFDIPPFPKKVPRSHVPLDVAETVLIVDRENNTIGECGVEIGLVSINPANATPNPVRSSVDSLSRQLRITNPQERAPPVLSHHPESQRHFRVSIDVRSIKDIKMHAANIYIRYTYPEFESARPVMTQPPVEVHKHSEVRLPRSFCAFEFSMTGEQIRRVTSSHPLSIEVWHKDRYVKDMLLGVAIVDLSAVLDDTTASHSGTNEHPVQTFDSYYNVVSQGKEGEKRQKAGEVRVILSFEDLGPLDAGQPDLRPTNPVPIASGTSTLDSSRGLHVKSPGRDTTSKPLIAPSTQPISQPPAMTAEAMTLAAELESWKEEEMRAFELNLQHLEAYRMDTIEKEWRRREKQRELMFEKRQSEYNKLETHLRKAVADLEDRERRLVLAEDELKGEAAKIRNDADRKVADAQAVTRRTREEFAHQIALERKRYAELERSNKSKIDQHQRDEQKITTLEDEISRLRLAMHETPTAKLHSDLVRVKGEKSELDRKLADAVAEKERFRGQCNRYARQVLQLQRDVREVEAKRLEREKRDVDQMRLFYLARQETSALHSESDQITDLKKELARFKNETSLPSMSTAPVATAPPAVPPPQGNHDLTAATMAAPSWESLSAAQQEVSRLVAEKQALVSTGAYPANDPVIQELDSRIAACEARLRSAHAIPATQHRVR